MLRITVEIVRNTVMLAIKTVYNVGSLHALHATQLCNLFGRDRRRDGLRTGHLAAIGSVGGFGECRIYAEISMSHSHRMRIWRDVKIDACVHATCNWLWMPLAQRTSDVHVWKRVRDRDFCQATLAMASAQDHFRFEFCELFFWSGRLRREVGSLMSQLCGVQRPVRVRTANGQTVIGIVGKGNHSGNSNNSCSNELSTLLFIIFNLIQFYNERMPIPPDYLINHFISR